MMSESKLLPIVDELVQVLQLQAKETEKLANHLEQTTTRLASPHQFSTVVSELSSLQVQIRKLSEALQDDSAPRERAVAR